MPELPEVEITARRLDEALRDGEIVSALAPGINAMRTFDPPLSALEGERVQRVGRRGKHFVIELSGELVMLIHLMSAGRLQLYDRKAGPRERTSRVLVRLRLRDGSDAELRLREFGSKQAAWMKLLHSSDWEQDDSIAKLGPEAWPSCLPLEELLVAPRPLHAVLRDQHVIAGIGRSWVDEILWQARLSPFKRASELSAGETQALQTAILAVLGAAIERYEQAVSLPIPDKLPMPLQVHRHEGDPCPRCGATLQAVHFEDYVIAYCPPCQTGGRTLKDRRLSRLLK